MQGGRVLALFDNSPDALSVVPELPVHIGKESFPIWLAGQPANQRVRGLVAIGGARGADRYRIQQWMTKQGVRFDPILHPTALISPSANIGAGTQLLAYSLLAADAILGEACILNHRASVDHECILGHGIHLAPASVLCGCVKIGDHTMIGAGATVLPRITIGTHCIIGAGAVITRDVPDHVIMAGNPARVIGINPPQLPSESSP